MKNRELYLEKIYLNDDFSIKVDEDKQFVNIYNKNILIEKFSLKKRIYSFFKFLQLHIKSNNVIYYKSMLLYGKEIKINDNLFMQLVNKNDELIVEFFNYKNKERNILFTTKTNYITQKLFSMILIPEQVKNNPMFLIKPKSFKDIIDILSSIKI